MVVVVVGHVGEVWVVVGTQWFPHTYTHVCARAISLSALLICRRPKDFYVKFHERDVLPLLLLSVEEGRCLKVLYNIPKRERARAK